jgi:hypothetical protein
MSDCLHCDIHEMLERHLQSDQADLAEIAAITLIVLNSDFAADAGIAIDRNRLAFCIRPLGMGVSRQAVGRNQTSNRGQVRLTADVPLAPCVFRSV